MPKLIDRVTKVQSLTLGVIGELQRRKEEAACSVDWTPLAASGNVVLIHTCTT
jgi:hypothetical protein